MVSVVQTADTYFNGSTTTVNFVSNVVVGNSVIVWIGDYNTSGTVISSAAPTYNGSSVTGATKLFDVQSTVSGTSNIMYAAVWLLPNVQSSGTSVTVVMTNANSDVNSHLFVAEVSGLGASPVSDTASPNPATSFGDAGGTLTSGATGNAVGASGIALGCMMQDGVNSGWTGPAGWATLTFTTSYCGAGYQIFTSSGSNYTWNPTGTGAGQWAAGAVILDAATLAAFTPMLEQLPPIYQQRIG